MRAAEARDLPALTAFLGARVETSMFPLGNLLGHGFGSDGPRQMRFWIAGDPPTGVVGLSGAGMILPQIDPAEARAAARALAGLSVAGLAGESAQLRALIPALGLSDTSFRMNHDEPQFSLSLADLVLPECSGLHLVPAAEADRDLLVGWRADYDVEVLGGTPDAARAEAERTIDGWIAAGSHRVLLRDGTPVAMTGFNASLPGIVQIGGVWTPPALRRQGLARRAVALHLAEARDRGVSRATLFSASDHAARAYRALGFVQTGRFTLTLLRDPQEVRPV